MLEKIKRFLFYFGSDRATIEPVMLKVCHSNRLTVAIISFSATLLILTMYISTFFVKGVASNRNVYCAGTIMSLIIFIASALFAKKHTWLVRPLVYTSYFIFYTYGMLIGIVTDPKQKTVTFIVMLVFLPVLFIDRPLHNIITTGTYVSVFVILCYKTKTGAVLQNDVIDAIVFGILGLISGMMVNRGKIHGYILENKLQEVSRFDQLTQMNNRNAYELCLESIPEYASTSLACIYIDVNGLHELNNTKGHTYGDEMLKSIAEEIQIHFGEELSFRIGGDEFVVFAPDMGKVTIEQSLSELTKNIEMMGYHVAIGFEICSVHNLSMGRLIKSAETEMYKRKKQFYKNRMYNRRRE